MHSPSSTSSAKKTKSSSDSHTLQDTRSVKSKSSELSSTSTQHAIDILKALSGNSVRRSRCRPEFLEELAKGVALAALDKHVAERLKIIAGAEGVAFFRKFLGESTGAGSPEAERKGEGELKKNPSTPVVFAVSAIDAGRKVVDYYMTWKGKTRAKHLKGSDRRSSLLDDEFRRVARTLDREYKRVSLLSSNDDMDAPRSHKSDRAESTKSRKRRSSPSLRTRTPPPNIVVSPPDPVTDGPSPIFTRLSTANDSVISLPFLNMIRNVPLGNRVPLRVTNPDTISILSTDVHEEPTQVPNNTSLETLVEAAEGAEKSPGDPERQASVDTLVQASDADQKRLGPPKKERSHKGDAVSVSSSGSRSSRSSKSSRSSRHGSRSRKDSSGSSTRRKHHEPSSRSKSDKKEHSHRHPSSSSRRKDHDGEGGSSSRKYGHHGSSGRHDEKKGEDDDRSSRKSDRSSSSSKKSRSDDISSDFLIVLLDTDKVDKDPFSWHGLGRSVSTRSATKTPPARTTPWSGPLVRPSDGGNHIHPPHHYHYHHPSGSPYDSDNESSSDDEWKDSPVIPLKSYVEVMNTGRYASDTLSLQPRAVIPPMPPVGVPIPVTSYVPSAASINSYTSTAHGGYTPSGVPGITISLATSVASSAHTATNGSGSPYLYSSPRPVGSPYVPAWISPQSPGSIQLPLVMAPPRPASGGSVYPGGYVQSARSTPPF